MSLSEKQRFVMVSNRLPVTIRRSGEKLLLRPGAGGLITALSPVLRRQGGSWIGWPGTTEFSKKEILAETEAFMREEGYSLYPVMLSQEEKRLYYDGFSNEILWPLFHELHSLCRFDPRFWEGYLKVNRKFAKEVVAQSSEDDFIWIHDYHHLTLGEELRKTGAGGRLAFFLHIPFAPVDIFLKIPWRIQLLRAMLQYDFIGFQTKRDQMNFLQAVQTLLKDVEFDRGSHSVTCSFAGRKTVVGAYPISIDYEEFNCGAKAPEVAEEAELLKENLDRRQLVFSLDRLDYTKGIPYRLEAIRYFLKRFPKFIGKVTFIQVVVPSRIGIPEYDALKKEIDTLVGEINSEFTKPGWVPIQYIFHPISRRELLAYYRAADACLITSVRDGMNLVSKEYAAANVEEKGVLILSEFAGAASQFVDQAVLVNPHDLIGLSDAMHYALTMPERERTKRMHKMRLSVKQHDIYRWLETVFKEIEKANPVCRPAKG